MGSSWSILHRSRAKTVEMTTITKDCFGASPDGQEVSRFTLTRGKVELSVISWGATITAIRVDGEDIVSGFDAMAGYTSAEGRGKNPYFGAVVGRVANRIADGKFKLDGKEYQLAQNNGPNALHGGLVGLDKVVWIPAMDENDGTVTFSYLGRDGEEGYPGDVLYNVRYSLDQEGGVRIDFTGTVTAATPLNLANHVYFNLAGHKTGAAGLEDHVMRMAANSFTPVSDKLIPTGSIASVAGTVFDLRTPTRLGDVLSKCPGGANNGFDHNFVMANTEAALNFVPTDESLRGKEGAIYKKHGGFCLETQKFPDSINQPNFPSCVVRPVEVYKHTVIYKVGSK